MPEPIAAKGKTFGICGDTGANLNLLVIGESTVEGVGVLRYDQTISAKIASKLSTQLKRTICWQALGKIGAKVAFVRKNLVPLIDQKIDYEVIVVLLGANDSIQLTPPATWQRELSMLLEDLQKMYPKALIYIATLPPVGQFPVIPQPTRFFLGLHNKLLVSTTQKMLRNKLGVIFSKLIFEKLAPNFFSQDGVHPSEAAYASWAEKITAELTPVLQQ